MVLTLFRGTTYIYHIRMRYSKTTYPQVQNYSFSSPYRSNLLERICRKYMTLEHWHFLNQENGQLSRASKVNSKA